MFKRPGLRFSLFSLLLVLTLAAVSVSHLRTSWVLSQTRSDLATAREEAHRAKNMALIRQAMISRHNDELGRLTISDPAQVHVISDSVVWRTGAFEPDRPPKDLSWKLHLPKGTRWKVWWAASGIPATEISESKRGGFELAVDEVQRAYVQVSFQNPYLWRWDLLVSDSADLHDHVRLTTEESRWLNSQVPMTWEGPGGDQNAVPHTKLLPADQPIVIQRIKRTIEQNTGDDPPADPGEGFMIWIEPIP